MSDDQLVVAIAGASNDALAELYRRHAPWLLARLRHRCADDGIVAEALQDTFVAVWKAATSFDGTRRGRRLAVGYRHPPPYRPVAQAPP